MGLNTVHDLVEQLHQQYEAGHEFSTLGCAKAQIYRNKLTGGGIKGNLRLAALTQRQTWDSWRKRPVSSLWLWFPMGNSPLTGQTKSGLRLIPRWRPYWKRSRMAVTLAPSWRG